MNKRIFRFKECPECGCDSTGSEWGIYCSFYCFKGVHIDNVKK